MSADARGPQGDRQPAAAHGAAAGRSSSDTAFWREVETAFSSVIASGEDARRQALDAHCGGRPDVRAEVEALLAAHAGASGFLTPDTGEPHASSGLSPALEVPSQVGAFRLAEQLGEGGMGTVYRALRVAGEFDQEVAVKLIAARLYGSDTLRRFRAERQILASLQHPGIVALLDGGVTAAGQPYIVMERVRGVPITEYCRRRRSPLAERLRLFQQLCAAVAYAHRHLVVHRDLKPANVLVTDEGTVKVLDFGVAKLLASEGPGSEATGALLGPLTPDYASPEQLRGAPVTTACDVYSLGVVLYELLTGHKPYATTGKTLAEVMCLVVQRDPARLSAAPAGAVPYAPLQLCGDLEAIVLAAMAKEPERRCPSAEELKEELQRHLDGRPVASRAPSLRYLASKAVARHRAAFTVASVSLLLLLAALAGISWHARAAARERERALRRYADVRRLTHTLIFKVHDAVAPLPGSTAVRRTVVAEALTFLDALQREADDDPALRVELAQGYMRIGRALGFGGSANLGDSAGALAAQRQARDLLRPLVATLARNDDAARAWIDANLNLSYAQKGAEGAAALEAALQAATAWVARAPRDAHALELLAKAHFRRALLAGPSRALPHWLEANRLFEIVLSLDPQNDNKQRNVALTEKWLGGCLEERGDLPAALPHYRRAYDLDLQRVGASRDNASAQLDLAIDIGNVAAAELKTGDYPAAIAAYTRSLEIRARLSRADPDDVRARGRTAFMHARLAEAYRLAGQPRAARQHVARALELQGSLPGLGVERAQALTTLAEVEVAARNRTAACRAFREASQAFRRDARSELGQGGQAARERMARGIVGSCP